MNIPSFLRILILNLLLFIKNLDFLVSHEWSVHKFILNSRAFLSRAYSPLNVQQTRVLQPKTVTWTMLCNVCEAADSLSCTLVGNPQFAANLITSHLKNWRCQLSLLKTEFFFFSSFLICRRTSCCLPISNYNYFLPWRKITIIRQNLTNFYKMVAIRPCLKRRMKRSRSNNVTIVKNYTILTPNWHGEIAHKQSTGSTKKTTQKERPKT